MKKMTLDEWEKKYIRGPIEQFDQKNTMFLRPLWDPEVNKRLDDWSFVGEVKDRPGYRIEDLGLRWAARRGTMLMGLFNWYKPNPSPMTMAVKDAIQSRDPSMKTITGFAPPEGVKIDTKDVERVTRIVKKAARWFGADDVGICRLDRRWVYSHTFQSKGMRQISLEPGTGVSGGESLPQEIPEEFQYAVVLVYEEEYDLIKHYPSHIAHAATSMGYSRMAVTNNYLATFIRHLGYQTIDCTTNDVANSIPMAMQAGLGDIGRNGLLVHPKWGPRVRL
ncbi:MAG: hypothetical protein JRJ29_11230, partial [Deltaproteobacteria bacterium]|nr:hypothetical protein [Deltaproteobacteria bacterium]